MANQTIPNLPATNIPVLEGRPEQFSLPWRRFFQTIAPGSGGGGGGNGTGNGTVTSITAGVGLTGGTITTEGTIGLQIPVESINGGTGFTAYADGEVLIGDGGTGSLDKSTLTAGDNVRITNGPGSITISASSWFPLVNGAEPPSLISDGAGQLIAVAYAP